MRLLRSARAMPRGRDSSRAPLCRWRLRRSAPGRVQLAAESLSVALAHAHAARADAGEWIAGATIVRALRLVVVAVFRLRDDAPVEGNEVRALERLEDRDPKIADLPSRVEMPLEPALDRVDM